MKTLIIATTLVLSVAAISVEPGMPTTGAPPIGGDQPTIQPIGQPTPGTPQMGILPVSPLPMGAIPLYVGSCLKISDINDALVICPRICAQHRSKKKWVSGQFRKWNSLISRPTLNNSACQCY